MLSTCSTQSLHMVHQAGSQDPGPLGQRREMSPRFGSAHGEAALVIVEIAADAAGDVLPAAAPSRRAASIALPAQAPPIIA